MDLRSPSLETLRAQYKREAEPTPYGWEVCVGAGIILLGTAGLFVGLSLLINGTHTLAVVLLLAVSPVVMVGAILGLAVLGARGSKLVAPALGPEHGPWGVFQALVRWPDTWPWIGIQRLDAPVACYGEGAIVAALDADGPAAPAGLQVGDMIIAIGELLVRDPEHANAIIMRHWPGHMVVLHVVREGNELTVRVEAEKRPVPTGPETR